jgi:hypothetical protein
LCFGNDLRLVAKKGFVTNTFHLLVVTDANKLSKAAQSLNESIARL